MNGEQQRRLHQGLLGAFPDAGSMRQMVKFGLNQNLDAIANTSRLDIAVFELMQWAESRDKTISLVAVARNSNPDNAALRTIAEELHLAPVTSELEKIVISSVGITDVNAWHARMSRCELTVCSIEISPFFGTGFLIGPDIVVTNHHVIKEAITGAINPKEVVLRFDFKTDESGTTVQPGQEYKLAENWLIDSSPKNELDYAILRVEGKPGEMPVAGQHDAVNRGWLTPLSYTFTNGEPLFIIQHPEAKPLSIAPGSFLNHNASPQRIIHSVSTLGGSSGSPCFTSNWDLVALHCSGSSGGNYAVPFSTILPKLQMKKISGLLI